MPNALEQMLKQISQWWGSLSNSQRILFVFGAAAFGLVLGACAYWATRPDYTVLYSNLTPQDASAIVDVAREKKIPYRLAAGGTQVEVPSAQVYDLRLELAGKGLPHGDGAGFEMFDKMSFGVTDEVQRINYQRALQSELERTIDRLEAVEKSRVHLVIPKDDMWFEESFAPSASVMLTLRTPGMLSQQQAEAIRHLLASAVRDLSPERVTIVDTSGKVLCNGSEGQGTAAGLSGRQLEYKNKLEKDLMEKAGSLLAQILGPGKAVVRIEAEVDFDQVVKEREYYEPVVNGKGLVRTEQQFSLTPAQGQPQAAGVAGTASNLQGYPPAGMVQVSGGSKNDRVTKYEMNRTVERITSATGGIQKLTVGVFIDGTQTPQALTDIQGVLANALGLDEKRGDRMTLKAFPFNREDTESQKDQLEKSRKNQFWLRLGMEWGPRVLLALVALGLVFTGTRALQRYLDRLVHITEEQNHKGSESLDGDKILAMIKQNPAETGQILKHWLS